MGFVIMVLATIAGALGLAASGAPLWLWTVVSGAWLLSLQVIADTGSFMLWLAWGLLAAANSATLRQRLLMAPALKAFRRSLPSMSDTEREALEAGSVWWDAELFAGQPNWQRLMQTPSPELSAEEQAFLDGPVEELCTVLDAWDISYRRRDLPPEVWEFIRRHRFFGMIIPKSEGGLGFSAQAHSAVVSKISSRSVSAAITVMVPNSLGPAELLHRYGTPEQKQHYLPRLATGDEIPCFALTGPEAGSDAASIPDYGIVCHGEYQGKRTLGLKVTWEKRYITLGPVATVLGLAFRVFDPDHLLGDEDAPGITLALIPTNHPGVNIGRRHFPAGQAFMNGPNSGKDVFIPMSWVIGGQEQVGQGWRMLMNCLAAGRAISLPALATAAAKVAARTTGSYARIRKQFKVPIGTLEGVEEPLARIAAEAYSLEAARSLTAVALDLGEEPSVISAMLKYRSTEGMRQALNDAMDVHGGRGICLGPSNYLSNGYQAIPMGITVEGANILTRSLIVFGQGAMRCHPWLLREMEAARDADDVRALREFDTALGGHVRYLLGNLGRALIYNLSGGRLAPSPAVASTRYWFRQLSRYSASFSLVADSALLTLGGTLKRREKLSGRLADVLSELYILSAVLKRYEDDGRPAEDLPVVEYVCANGLHRIQGGLREILDNLPVRPVAMMLRGILFPFGARRRPADDALGGRVAALLLEPSATRDRISTGIFISREPLDITGRLEHGLAITLKAEPVERKVYEALREGRIEAKPDENLHASALAAGVITEAEASLLAEYREAVRRVIDVDDFAPEELSPAQAQERRAEKKTAAA
jgi:acyl-CoA dehydrogenase